MGGAKRQEDELERTTPKKMKIQKGEKESDKERRKYKREYRTDRITE